MFCNTKAVATLHLKTSYFGYLGHFCLLSSKTIMPTCRNLDIFICMQKMNSISYFVFEILQTFDFEYFENAWTCPSVRVISPCKKVWFPKCWNRFVGNFDVSLHAKKWTPFFFEILQICYSEYFENAWPWPSIMIVSPCKKIRFPKCWNQLAGSFNVYLHAKN